MPESHGSVIIGVATELIALAAANFAISQERKSFKENQTSILKSVRFNAQIFPQFDA